MKLPFSITIGLIAATSNQLVSAQIAPVCESLFPHDYDSGITSAAFTTISYDATPWIQLDLSKTQLASNTKLILVGQDTSQILDAAALEANPYSAEFDGSSVTLELLTPGGIRSGSTSRVIVSNIRVGLCEDDGIASSICGGVDDRTQSSDERAGRIGGCTGWLISENVFVQAGHCGTPSTNTRLHFTYGTGSAASVDQYAVDVSTYRFLNGGVGQDWGAARLLPNSGTSQLPGVAQEEKCVAAGKSAGCGWYTVGTVPSSTTGNNIRVTGYGTADVDSRSQKTHIDSLTTIGSNYLRYVPDTTGGNSGSPVIHEETGHAVGVHTHGGCDSGGNHGTRIDRPDFAAHIDFLTKSCTLDSQCDDGIFCNGAEYCDASGQCQFGTAQTCEDGLACTEDICNELTDSCENPITNCLASGDSCATDQCIESQGGCQFTCGAILETWTGIGGTSIANLMSGTNNMANAPNKLERLGGLLEGPTNTADNYGSRMSGWLVPPVTGDYEFWIATDDNGEFWLSTNAERSNKIRVCHVPGWAGSRAWTKFPEQKSTLISLVAGQAYYMEAIMKEGSGGDNLAIAWQYPGQALEVIPASYSVMTKPTPVTPSPSGSPSKRPTAPPTNSPITPAPTNNPTGSPTKSPSIPSSPTNPPTNAPSDPPTRVPTSKPTVQCRNKGFQLSGPGCPSSGVDSRCCGGQCHAKGNKTNQCK